MPDRFEICHPITARWEGGWSDHKDDPGGKTNLGVTEAKFHEWLNAQGRPLRPVRSITAAEALAIYRGDYWDACGAPSLFPGVDLAVYDASVNSGVSRGRKWLATSIGSNDHSVTVKRICAARLSFMQALAIWKTFGKGWGRRVADIEVKGVAMALAAMGATDSRIRADARAEAEAAKKAAKTADTTAKTTAAGGASGGVATAIDAGGMDVATLSVFGALAVAAIGAAAIIYIRKRAQDARAAAYAEVAA